MFLKKQGNFLQLDAILGIVLPLSASNISGPCPASVLNEFGAENMKSRAKVLVNWQGVNL